MIDEQMSFDEKDRVDFPNYIETQPVQTARHRPRQPDLRYNLPDTPQFETHHHESEEVPTLVRYEDDRELQEEFDQYVAAESFKKYQRRPFQPTELPKPRSGVGPVVIDETNYQPYIDYLTRETDDLIYFVTDEEEKL